jgi:putative protease
MNHIELLAPGGDLDCIKAAIAAGADAVYCGIDRFNARNRAENITFSQLRGILRLAHSHNCKVFLTLNIIIVEDEISAFVGLLNELSNTSIDGIILQDIGMLYLVNKYFKGLEVHASTQLTTHNRGQIDFLAELGVSRVNLSREMNLKEIEALSRNAHDRKVKTEVFVHGSNCLSFSGLCYISSVLDGKSGNRGRCSQPCRDQYLTTPAGKEFPLNLKDNCAFADLADLAAAGVDSLKIEGRIKKFHYVYTVVETYRKQLENLCNNSKDSVDSDILYKVFNRDFTNAYLKGEISRDMFIDYPRDNSALHLAKDFTSSPETNLETAKSQLYDEKTDIIVAVKAKIDTLSADKAPLTITFAGKQNSPLTLTLTSPDFVTSFSSASLLIPGPDGENSLNAANLGRILKKVNDTEFYIENMLFDDLEEGLLLPYHELTTIKKKILSVVGGTKEPVAPVTLPRLKRQKREEVHPTLSLLISSEKDLSLCHESARVYFEIPSCLTEDSSALPQIFHNNKQLIPWFPPVIIGEYYERAVQLLEDLQPQEIVTNNYGIAQEAHKRGIAWVAGPYLNIANSHTLICLKEMFGCEGAFISNELRNFQIKTIKKPKNFKLYYSIYHPILLMTTRQCLFQQVTGCEKSRVEGTCLETCRKSAKLHTVNNTAIMIEKSAGNYHALYHCHNFLNTGIINDIPELFSSFFIDLRDIETETAVTVEKGELIEYFAHCIRGDRAAAKELQQLLQPTTHRQYIKGI